MTGEDAPRAPRVFRTDDPKVVVEQPVREAPPSGPARQLGAEREFRIPTAGAVQRGVRWGVVLLSAIGALAALAAGVWFARFVSVALARQDWVGWTAFVLLSIVGVAALMMVLRELVGLIRLDRVHRIRADAERVVAGGEAKLARSTVERLRRLLGARPALALAMVRLKRHERDIRAPHELLRLAERELVVPIDAEARRVVVAAAKRVSVVTAMSPLALLTVGFVVVENMRMLRRLAALYGGRPGLIGLVRLFRMVIGHIIMTGGVALTDDLLHQFLGQDLLRRLSRRLGEGVFNGTLTARVGTAAIGVIRPLPFLDSEAPRLRDIVAELVRREKRPDAE